MWPWNARQMPGGCGVGWEMWSFDGNFMEVYGLTTGWWFQTFFIVHNIWDNPSHWLILFKMVKTTNQTKLTNYSSLFIGWTRFFFPRFCVWFYYGFIGEEGELWPLVVSWGSYLETSTCWEFSQGCKPAMVNSWRQTGWWLGTLISLP